MKLSDHKKDDVTDTLTGLMNKHNVNSHVNFVGFDIQTGGG